MVAVNPEILIWARKTAALSVDEAARKLGFRDTKKRTATEKLNMLENGETEPSMPQLYKMAKVYFQPLLVFYLNQPPAEIDRGEDFRTLPQKTMDAKGNAHLKLLMRNVKVAQNLIGDALEDDQADILPFVNSASMSTGVMALATTIREMLDFDLETFRKAKTYRKAFAYLREQIESRRIFLLLLSDLGSHHSTIPVHVFRGFVYSDNLAPFIVINRKDAVSAWSFTALHEVAHLFLGSSGVSGQWGNLRIERFCNQVAGEILFPSRERNAIHLNPDHGIERVADRIGSIARANKLSRAMVAYSLYLTGRIDELLWHKLNSKFEDDRQLETERANDDNKASEGGPSYYVVRRHQLGNALVKLTKQFVDTGQLQPTKAALVLGVKPLNVYPLLNPNAARVRG